MSQINTQYIPCQMQDTAKQFAANMESALWSQIIKSLHTHTPVRLELYYIQSHEPETKLQTADFKVLVGGEDEQSRSCNAV